MSAMTSSVCASKMLTASDVIEPTQWYEPKSIEKILGIRVADVERARADHRFISRRGDDDSVVRGAELLEWISVHRVAHELTPFAIAMYARRFPLADSQPASPPASSAVD